MSESKGTRLEAFLVGYLWGQREPDQILTEDELATLAEYYPSVGMPMLAATQGTYPVLEGWLSALGSEAPATPGIVKAMAQDVAKRVLLKQAAMACAEMQYAIKIQDTVSQMAQLRDTLQAICNALDAYTEVTWPAQPNAA